MSIDTNWNDEASARENIREAVSAYYHKFLEPKQQHKPGSRISYGGRVFDEKEVCTLVDSALDFWLTAGRFSDCFEKEFAEFLGVRYASIVNSGSSANLIAFMALTSSELGDRRIMRGDEVITVAAGFPTTVSPIVQYGAVPVFVDVSIPQYNIDCSLLEAAYSPKTKAVMIAHTLGNPFNLEAVRSFCDAHQLWLVEDNCDALGSRYTLNGQEHFTGTFGDIATHSFYPAHHITMGEGGCVVTDNPLLHKLVNSFRDWGRDCICPGGKDNCCGKRFSQQLGELPFGYDHKYVYSHFGYNLKVSDMQAAVGCEQLQKLPYFIKRRRENWSKLHELLLPISNKIILPEPAENSNPSWFGFLMTIREDSGLTREKVVRSIEDQDVQTRNLFSGNLTRHPCFDEMRSTGSAYRIVGTLDNTDRIMNNSFWVGVYPGLTDELIAQIAAAIISSVN